MEISVREIVTAFYVFFTIYCFEINFIPEKILRVM